MELATILIIAQIITLLLVCAFFVFAIVLLIRFNAVLKTIEKILDFSDWLLLLQKFPKKLFNRKK